MMPTNGNESKSTALPTSVGTPWGIYVISAACALLVCVAAWSFPEDTGLLKWFDVITIILSSVLCIGTALRLNAARMALLALLLVSLALESPLFFGAWIQGKAIYFGRVFVRAGLTVWAIAYLTRPHVALAFTKADATDFTQLPVTRFAVYFLLGMILGYFVFLVLMLVGLVKALGYHGSNLAFCVILLVGGALALVVHLVSRGSASSAEPNDKI